MIPQTNQVNRFIAIDAHKHYLVIGGLDKHMQIVLHRTRRYEEAYRYTRGGTGSHATWLNTTPPAAGGNTAAGGFNLTCQHIGRWFS
jgi:hypothetical protein